jgi:hypothetical protein
MASLGRQFVVGDFETSVGREITGVFDAEGRVYCPSPYDLPRDPYKVAWFAVNMLAAMIDTELITDEYFSGRQGDALTFREGLKDLQNNISFFSKISMVRQPPWSVV